MNKKLLLATALCLGILIGCGKEEDAKNKSLPPKGEPPPPPGMVKDKGGYLKPPELK